MPDTVEIEIPEAQTAEPVDKQALQTLMRRSDGPGLRRIGIHFALIAATGTLVMASLGTWWLLPAMLPHGILLGYLFAAEHETTHRTAFRSRWLNEAVHWIAGLVIVLPPSFYRAFHFEHHRFTQDPDRDPELGTKKVETWPGYLRYMTGWTYWQRGVMGLVNGVLGRAEAPYIGPRDKTLIVRDCRIMAAVYAAAALSAIWLGPWPLYLWLGPLLLAQPVVRMWIVTEHTGCPYTSNPTVADMLRNTRTTHTNALMRLINWNMSYHAEHHSYPAVPFHALPKLHALIGDRVETQTSGYRAFHTGWWRRLYASAAHESAGETAVPPRT